jgi:hypothetical protein
MSRVFEQSVTGMLVASVCWLLNCRAPPGPARHAGVNVQSSHGPIDDGPDLLWIYFKALC